MYDPLNSGFDNAAQDALNPQWNSPPRTSKQLPPPSDGFVTSPGLIATSPVQPLTPQSRGPFGREPQIYGQPEPGLISPATNKASNGQSFERPEPYLRVRITALDRNRRDILIKFDAQTNLPTFTAQTYRNISRSYFEFRQFSEQIVYSNPQTIVPALPLSQTSAPSDDEDDRLVKYMLQRWFTRICEDPFILQDEELRLFIESDFGYQPTPHARRKTSSGFSLLKRGIPDEDEDLQRARFELTKLETQYFDVARSVDRLARARKSLSVAQAEMGNKLISVATSESHPPLANAFKKFGRVWHSLADLDQAQAISECVVLGDSMGYQGLNARSAKETLLQRAAVLEEHHAAVKSTITKRRQIERLKGSSNIRPDKVDEALEELDEATKFEEMLAQRVDGISQNLHRGLHRHSKLVQDDITVALIENARSSILYEKQLLLELESLRNDFNNAAKPAPPPSQPAAAIAPTVRPLTPPQAQSGSWTVPRKTEATRPQPGQGSSPPIPPRFQAPASVVPPKHTLPHIHTQHVGSTSSVAVRGPISSDVVPPNRNTLQGTTTSAYTTVSAPPSAVAGPGYMGPLSTPGAGPSIVRSTTTTTSAKEVSSSSVSTFGQILASSPPAPFRHADGTKSMIAVGHGGHTQASSGLGGGGQARIPPASGFDPLLSPGSGFNTSASSVGAANGNGYQQQHHHHPLAASMIATPSAGAQALNQFPSHADNPENNMQASQYGTMRRRLDAREAAAKLANLL